MTFFGEFCIWKVMNNIRLSLFTKDVLKQWLNSDLPEQPVPTSFNKNQFYNYCKTLEDNPTQLSSEYNLLEKLSSDRPTTTVGCLDPNKSKNRYNDILPYDKTRVELKITHDNPFSDYINASWISGLNDDHNYIACQAPKEETKYDFWRMIDEKNVPIIVMLTHRDEHLSGKCSIYYPTNGIKMQLKDITIELHHERTYKGTATVQRTIYVRKNGKKQKVNLLHFTDWPDHSVPDELDSLIYFCHIKERLNARGRAVGPTVVHCSAGVGRTGTFITIDSLLRSMKENKKLDVFGTVYRLRHARMHMVQTEEQYGYIYRCIRHAWINRHHHKKMSSRFDYHSKLDEASATSEIQSSSPLIRKRWPARH